MLRISKAIFAETIERLRRCGRGRAECVVYWLASRDARDEVVAVVHPEHDSSPVHYDIAPSWLTRFWLHLSEMDAVIVAQIHTHPGSAFHSSRDDALAILHRPGFLSLVLPRFAQDRDPLNGAHLARIDDHGHWDAIAIERGLEVA